jgi:hypothetical protein
LSSTFSGKKLDYNHQERKAKKLKNPTARCEANSS